MVYHQPQSGPASIDPYWLGVGLNSLYMSLNGSGAIRDYTGRYTAAVTGTPPPTAVGPGGIAMSFNGSTQYFVPPALSLSYGSAAISRFALVSVTSVAVVQTISSSASFDGFQFRLNASSLSVVKAGVFEYFNVAHGLSAGQLAVVGVTWDGATIRGYVNGREIGSAACVVTFADGSDRAIGQRGAGSEFWGGKIYAHADFNKAVSRDDARALSAALWQLFLDEDEDEGLLYVQNAAAAGFFSRYYYDMNGVSNV